MLDDWDPLGPEKLYRLAMERCTETCGWYPELDRPLRVDFTLVKFQKRGSQGKGIYPLTEGFGPWKTTRGVDVNMDVDGWIGHSWTFRQQSGLRKNLAFTLPLKTAPEAVLNAVLAILIPQIR